MKKAVCIALAAALTFPLAACDGQKPELGTVHVYMPDGAPAVALAAMMDSGYADTEFTVVTADTIVGYVSNGTADLAIMPINAAATLYNNGVGITMLSVNTHGNMYLVGKTDETVELADLTGKRVGSIGQGQVPDLTLRMMLDSSEVEFEITTGDAAVDGKAAIRYPGVGEALPGLLNQGKIDYAFLAEPAVSTAAANFGFHIVMDAQAQWTKLFGGDYPQACLVASNRMLEYPEYIDAFIAELKRTEAEKWAENNPDRVVETVKAHFVSGSTSTSLTTLTKDAIARCNISTVDATTARATCEKYFEKLVGMPTEKLGTTVLSALPTDAFYYNKK